ncbi:MAG: hypothetical protein HC880_05335 [Bacteroidia bacterium]|nr:hypothetical protein [Bacteroidia bacterium]
MNFKGFDLSFLFTGATGFEIFNGTRAYSENVYGDYNTTADIFGASFFLGNGLTGQPRVFDEANNVRDPNGNYSTPSSYFIEDGAYFKLKNLQLGYTLPQNLLGKVSGRVYVTGQNIFTITGYSGRDPELAGDLLSRGIDYFGRYPHIPLVFAGG